eukprot:CAMPEP_0114169342 /NCGR_PEP_ID=MMETSP0043_2-20121206/33512_1 /TAXON_ID=464988 /ORGANISM="Hemiselmis andersenii, Strain CCMP644" /LENGTH=154 /DNA_ID=CAMNT_0001266787 /DNA_START=1556 /DNA_END=2021 /DNA_ORIENTATION=-
MTNMLVWLSPRLALPPLNAAAQAATAPVALPKEHPECEEATREAQRKCHSKRCDSSTKHQKAATPHHPPRQPHRGSHHGMPPQSLASLTKPLKSFAAPTLVHPQIPTHHSAAQSPLCYYSSPTALPSQTRHIAPKPVSSTQHRTRIAGTKALPW